MPMKWSLQKITIYLVCCVVFLMLPIIVSPGFSLFGRWDIGAREIRNLITSALILLFFYGNYTYFIPAFYHRKKYLLFIGITIGSFLIIAAAPSFIYPKESDFEKEAFHKHPFSGFREQTQPGSTMPQHTVAPNIPRGMSFPNEPQPRKHFEWFQLESTSLKFLFIFVLSLLLKTRELWEIAQDEKRSAELSSLRLQVNPHFLFNTLNSIYSLALEKSDKTPEAIVKLSELMRYVTSEVGEDFVPLEKELNYISNYIELQRIRLADTVQIDYVVSGDWTEDRIAPLLLIPFIENAFKFGVNPEMHSKIEVNLSIAEHQLALSVANNKVQNNDRLMKSGTGLVNVQKRLKLIYPAAHKLILKDNNQHFEVKLTLQLT
jgi:hypothetical protein